MLDITIVKSINEVVQFDIRQEGFFEYFGIYDEASLILKLNNFLENKITSNTYKNIIEYISNFIVQIIKITLKNNFNFIWIQIKLDIEYINNQYRWHVDNKGIGHWNNLKKYVISLFGHGTVFKNKEYIYELTNNQLVSFKIGNSFIQDGDVHSEPISIIPTKRFFIGIVPGDKDVIEKTRKMYYSNNNFFTSR